MGGERGQWTSKGPGSVQYLAGPQAQEVPAWRQGLGAWDFFLPWSEILHLPLTPSLLHGPEQMVMGSGA